MTFINDIHYFRIPVTNLEESIDWYTNCLRLKLRRRKEDELAVIEICEGGSLLVLVRADEDSRGHFTINNNPEFSVGFTSPEIHKFYEYLIGKGVKVDEIKEESGHFYFHFFDPNGNKLQAHW